MARLGCMGPAFWVAPEGFAQTSVTPRSPEQHLLHVLATQRADPELRADRREVFFFHETQLKKLAPAGSELVAEVLGGALQLRLFHRVGRVGSGWALVVAGLWDGAAGAPQQID